MPIVSLKPDSPATNNTETVAQVLAAPNESTFTTLFPEASVQGLLKYVEGYPWSCNWFAPITTKGTTLEHFDITAENLTVPLIEVRGLILQVSSPFSPSYEASTGITAASGSAIVPLGLQPSVGSLFIANVDSGEDAIFIINNVERLTHRKDSLYSVTYTLFGYLSQHKDLQERLTARVQESYFFNKDSNYFNRDFLITKTHKEAKDRLNTFMRDSQEFYLRTFSGKEYGTIMIPGVPDSMYDPLLINFVGKFIDHEIKITHPWYRYNYTGRYVEQPSFFDLLMTRNPHMSYAINKRFGFVSSVGVRNHARFGTPAHTGLSYVLFPLDPKTENDIDRIHRKWSHDLFSDHHKESRAYGLSTLAAKSKVCEIFEPIPLLHKLFDDDYYVVTENFYNYLEGRGTTESLSYIETLVARFVNKQAIAAEDLVTATQSFYEWSGFHQFYLLPVMWLIIRNTL